MNEINLEPAEETQLGGRSGEYLENPSQNSR
jgi:hypothetical protein